MKASDLEFALQVHKDLEYLRQLYHTTMQPRLIMGRTEFDVTVEEFETLRARRIDELVQLLKSLGVEKP